MYESGIYFRFKNPETKSIERVCFEHLPREEQERILNTKNLDWIKSLTLMLADTLARVQKIAEIDNNKNK